MGHVLSKQKKTELPSKIIFFDSESWVENMSQFDIENCDLEIIKKEHKLYLIVACFYNYKSKKNNEIWRTYTDDNQEHKNYESGIIKKSFWSDVNSYVSPKQKIYVMAHNARYDTIITGAIPELINLGYNIESFSDSNPFFINFLNPGTKQKIVLLSSTNYFNTSIEKLGQTFNYQKGEIDYVNCTVEESIPYCRRDTEILKRAIVEYINLIKNEDLGSFRLTLAGQSFNAFRHKFMSHEIMIHRNTDVIKLERLAYAGGRNECWFMGVPQEELYYVDVNSMYPYVMQQNRFPTFLMTYRRHCTIEEIKHFISQGYLLTARITVKTDEPVYFIKSERLIFPVGTFETCVSTPELIHAIENNHIVKIHEVAVYDSDYIFRDYVEYFYNSRLNAKQKGDEVKTLMYKIFMNSLYGKFGQKINYWEKKCDYEDNTIIKEEIIINVDTGTKHKLKILGGAVFEKNNLPDGESESKNSFPAVAAHVTSYARMLLWKYIKIAGHENVYYMDTDSLFVTKSGYEKLLQEKCLDDSELGKLKLEEYKNKNGIKQKMIAKPGEVEIRGCKDYKFINENKIKGVNKKAIKIDETHYVTTMWPGLPRYIKEGKVDYYVNIIMLKELKREYKKGNIDENGNIKPFVLENKT